MSVLVSKANHSGFNSQFSKDIFTEVSSDLKVLSEEELQSTVSEFPEYKKVLIGVYVRTNKDNLVLTIDEGKFVSISNVPPFILDSGIYANTSIDAGLACAKDFIEQAFEFKDTEALHRFVTHSACFPVGAVETAKKYVLVFNIVIAEELLRDRDISLKQGFHFYPIETLSLTDSLQKEISKSLVVVKSEDKINE